MGAPAAAVTACVLIDVRQVRARVEPCVPPNPAHDARRALRLTHWGVFGLRRSSRQAEVQAIEQRTREAVRARPELAARHGVTVADQAGRVAAGRSLVSRLRAPGEALRRWSDGSGSGRGDCSGQRQRRPRRAGVSSRPGQGPRINIRRRAPMSIADRRVRAANSRPPTNPSLRGSHPPADGAAPDGCAR